MAKFCSRCGSLNDEKTGFCPVCDREKLEAALASQPRLNFCMLCGTPIDQATGNCPNCTKPAEVEAEQPAAELDAAVETVETASVPVSEEGVAEESVTEEAPVAVAVEEPPVAEEPAAEQPTVEAPVSVEPVVYAKKSRGVGKVILTIFMSLLLFITSLLSIAVICVRHTTSQGTIQSGLEEVDYVEVIDKVLSTEELVVDEFGEEVLDSKSFSDNLCEYLKEEHGVENVKSKQIEAFIEDSTIMDFISEKAADYIGDIYSGSDDFELTVKDIETLVEDNAGVIEEHFDITVNDSDIKEMTEWLVDEEMLEEISTSVVRDDNSEVFYVLNIGFSYFTMVILLALVLLCLVGMGLVDLSKGAMGAGIVFTTIGGLFTVAVLVLAGLPALLNSFIGENFISNLVMRVLSANLVVFASVLGFGVLILIVRCVVRRLVKRSRRAKVA